jgi:hypothetical protein
MKNKEFVMEITITCDRCGRTELLVRRFHDPSEALREVRDWAMGRDESAPSDTAADEDKDLCVTCSMRQLIDILKNEGG